MGNGQIFLLSKVNFKKIVFKFEIYFNFLCKNSPNDFIYFLEQYQTIFKDFL